MFRILILALVVALSVAYATAQRNDGSVISEKANLRGAPTQAGLVIAELGQGTEFALVKQEGAWFLIQTRTNVGWVHGDTIRLLSSRATAAPLYVDPAPSKTSTGIRAANPAPVQSAQNVTPSSEFIRGPRGGCYYINSRGNKTYVARELCNSAPSTSSTAAPLYSPSTTKS